MSEQRYAVAVGRDVGCIRPGEGFEPRVEFDQAALLDLLTKHEVRSKKDGRYLCRPMGGNGERSDDNAEAWRLVPVDVDELHSTDVPALIRWFEESKIAGCLVSTFSHRADQPRFRIWLLTSRLVLANEHAWVHRALESMVPFKLDPCMLKPSQPVFLPAVPSEHKEAAYSLVSQGEPLDVDRLLGAYREEMEAFQRDRATRQSGVGTGVRQPGGLIEYFNKGFDVGDLLEKHGYRRKSRNRYIAPSSKSRRAAVVLYDQTVVSFHEPAHDPLAVRNKIGQAIVLDAFGAFCKLEHQDDFKAAFNGALKWARAKGWSDSPVPQQQAPSAPPPPLHLFNPHDLYSNLKPQDMLVEGILDQGTVVIASGDSNSGKTTILQLLALQIALGAPFAAKRVKQGKVLWIAGEDMQNAAYRTVAMCEEYGISAQSIGDELLLLPQPVAVLQEDSMQALRAVIEQRVGAGAQFNLIVLDSKSVNWGGIDENSNDENAAFILAVRRALIEPFGNPSVVITHHLTKHKEKEAQSSRGASSLINNSDHEWRFEMNQDARISAMRPGSKVRLERWAEQRFTVKVVDLPQAKFAHLANNFGDMPRVSIAEPVNAYNRSMKQLQQDSDLRAVLLALASLTDASKPHGSSHIAQDLNWVDASSKPDYRKVKRILDLAATQKLADADGKLFEINDAGRAYIATDAALGDATPDVEPRQPGEDDE
jgi:hypothetical protein